MGDTAKLELIELRERDGKYSGTVRLNGQISGAPINEKFEFLFDKNPDKLRGVDKEETGDSKTATIPTEDNSNELPRTINEIPVGDYSIDEVKEENKNSDTNDKKLTSKDNS